MSRSVRAITRPMLGLPLRTPALMPPSPAMLTPEPTPRPSMLDAAVDWALYVDGVRRDQLTFAEAVALAKIGEGFIWLGLHQPDADQLAELGESFDIHPLVLEDVSNPRQRPKLARQDDTMVMALRTLAYIGHPSTSDLRRSPGRRALLAPGQGPGPVENDGGDIVETGAIMVVVGATFVVTVRHGRHAAMAGIRRHLEASPDLLSLGPSSVLHAVADKVVDDYLAVTDAVQADLEEIETGVFAPRASIEIERIYELKRDIIEMKRTVEPLGPALHELAERPRRLVHADIREYFRDVHDHHARVREQVASFDELLTSILHAASTRVSITENEDMRRISSWVAIAAVPTMMAGIFGMNFQYMPFLQSQWGFPALMGGMLMACGLLYRSLRRNGWL